MKKLMMIILCLCIVSPCFASDYNIQKSISYKNDIQTCQFQSYDNIDRTADAINMVIKFGLCYWGFSQNSTYGTITGLIFGTGATISLVRITFY